MNGRWFRAVVVVALATAPLVVHRAAGDDCLHVCAETDKDDRGCCPAAKPKLPPKRAPTQPKTAVTPKATGAATTPTTKPPPRSDGKCPSGMVHVPAGTFTMGTAKVGDHDEYPAHAVTLGGYCLDKTEVTVAAYSACVAAKACTATTEPAKDGIDSLCNGTRTDRETHPVNCVDWNQAMTYCTWASKRLPTEAEWEHAARGDDRRVYPWGNEAPNKRRLNACGTECFALFSRTLNETVTTMYSENDGWEATAPVASFPAGASPFGVLDLAGNVSEWTADLYGPYATGTVTNPMGATTGSAHVCRGGHWSSLDAGYVRGASRDRYVSGSRNSWSGFRCAGAD